jgi:hypothetical protein
MSKVRPRLTANQIRHPGSLLAESSISGGDVRVWRWVALRGEARDFYSGSPDYNVASLSGGQHNVFAGGAIVLRWH